MKEETIDEIHSTKCDMEFTISAGNEPEQYTAGVKIWHVDEDTWHLVGYWDMPNSVDDLGTPVTIKDSAPDMPPDMPDSVMKAVQDFLYLGLDIMDGQGIRVRKSERDYVHSLAKSTTFSF